MKKIYFKKWNYLIAFSGLLLLFSGKLYAYTPPTDLVATLVSQTNISCNGGSDGAATVTASGGTPAYTYAWSPSGGTGATATGLSAGTYVCTVWDANGSTATKSFTITQPTALSVTQASQTNIACNGGATGAATVNAATGGAGGYTYNWTPGNPTGDGTNSVTGLTAGTWTCTVTDANGCNTAKSFTINEPTVLETTAASQTNVSVNGGSNGAASINTPTGGYSPYTYNWTPGNPTGNGTTSVSGLTAGTWTCTVSDLYLCTATKDFTITAPPAITTQAVSSIASTTATGNGNITNLGVPNPSQYGVCWSTSTSPTTADGKTTQGAISTTGAFTSNITGLTASTTYYVRAYATNTAGTSYGNEVSFTTSSLTPSVSGISPTNGPTGGATSVTITGTNLTGATSVMFGLNAATGVTVNSDTEITATSPTGAIGTIDITVITAVGTSATSSFDEFAYVAVPTVTTDPATSVTSISVIFNGTINANNAATISQFEFGFSSGNYIMKNMETRPSSVSGTINTQVISNISGLTPNTTYYYRVKGINSEGTSFGEEQTVTTLPSLPTITTQAAESISTSSATLGGNITNQGETVVTERGVVYSTTDNTPTIDEAGVTKDSNGTGVDIFSEAISALSSGTVYYFQAYAINTKGTSYGGVETFTTILLPTITTQATTNITTTSATGNGNITNLGVPNPSQYGVCWSTSTSPTTADGKTTQGAISTTGAFTSSITGLTTGTTYYVRAYATNTVGTSYGNEVFFTTPNPTVTFTTASQSSIAETGTMTITAQLSAISGRDVIVPFAINGSSTATGSGADYSITASPITIAAGNSSADITITIVADNLNEADETVIIELGSPTNASLTGTTSHTATITNDDISVLSIVASAQATENTSHGEFTISTDKKFDSPITVNLDVSGTASSGVDYTALPASVVFPALTSSITLPVLVIDDAFTESDETVILALTGTNNTNVSISSSPNSVATITITDDDVPPAVNFTAATQSSTDESGTMTITAALTYIAGQDITVPFTISGASTATGGGVDYSVSTSPITITAGQPSANITITIASDMLDEDDETVIVNMGTPVNATQGSTHIHTATITDDDAIPTVTFVATSQTSGIESGTMTVIAVLNTISGRDVTIPFSISGTATRSSDYTASASPLTIVAGDLSENITLSIHEDDLNELNETIIINMGTLGNASPGVITAHTATITDDDDPPTVTLSASPLNIAEASAVSTLTATISAISGKDITINLAFSGTATGTGTDYTATPLITIPAGNLTGTTTITAVQDLIPEGNETIVVDISSATNATENGIQQQTVTITDDDAPVVNSVSVPANGIYKAGANLDFTATFNQAIGVNTTAGTPSIPITIGTKTVQANMTGTVTNSSTVTFRYTVAANDEDTDGITVGSSISLNGGIIANAINRNALNTLNGIGNTTLIKVDAVIPVKPVIASITNDSGTPADGATNDPTLLFAGTSEANSTVEVFINAVSIGTTTTNGTGVWNFDHTTTTLANGNYSITAIATDMAGNKSPASDTYTVVVDSVNPSLTIHSNKTDPTNEAFVAIFTFSEDVYNFTGSDVVTTNGTLSNFLITDATHYTATITPTSEGIITINVAAGVANDLSGNSNIAASQYQITYDIIRPTLTITSATQSPTNYAFTANFNFSEAVQGFTASDIQTTNASITNFTTVSASKYTATINPIADGNVIVEVNSNVTSDAARNQNTAAVPFTMIYDHSRPTVVITSSDIDYNAKSVIAHFKFSEPIIGFSSSDISLSNGTIGSFVSIGAENFSVLIENTTTTTVLVDLNAGMVQDASGNTNISAATMTVLFDETPPTVICKDTTIYLNPSGNTMLRATNIDNGSTDNLGIETMIIDKTSFTCSDIGANTVVLSVTDIAGLTATCSATVTVKDSITVNTKDISILLNQSGKASITVAQINDGSTNACGNLSFDLDISEFDCSMLGENTVTLTATDGSGIKKSATAIVTVISTNRAPLFSHIDDKNVSEDVGSFDVSISGITNGNCASEIQSINSLTASSNSNSIEKIDVAFVPGSETANLKVFVKENASGSAVITVSIKDDGGTENGGIDSYTATFNVNFTQVPDAPVAIGNIDTQIVSVGSSFNITLPDNLFTDADQGDLLTYSASIQAGGNIPTWLTYDANKGELSGTPTINDIGNFIVKLTATDKTGLSASIVFEMIVYNLGTSSITGKLYNENSLIDGGVSVFVYQQLETEPATYKLITESMVSYLGSFGFYNLEAGKYIVAAIITDTEKHSTLLNTYFEKTIKWNTAKIVELAANANQQIDLIMLQKPVVTLGDFQISGSIIRKAGDTTKSGIITQNTTTANGTPAANVTIFLKKSDLIIATAQTDTNGFYQFLDLVEGNYQLEVVLPGFTQQEVISMAIKPDATKVNKVNFTIWEGTNIVTDIPFLKQIAGLKLYPNPTFGHITIELINPLNQSATVSIYSISGQLVYQNEFRNENQIRIDLSDRKPGIYMVKISVGETQLTDKLILK